MGEAYEGTCTSTCPYFLGSVPYIILGSHGALRPVIIIEKLKPGREKNKAQK
jgi:hypothetical protein